MKSDLTHLIQNFADKKVVVWGDLILDEYVYTSSSRVSREAPVLITEFKSNEFKPGGAGNVVMNIKSLGGTPIPVGFIGRDHSGKELKQILKSSKITPDYLIELDNYFTPKKSRILSGGDNTKKQQVLRIDTLNKKIMDTAVYHEKLLPLFNELLQEAELLLISDYLSFSVNLDIFIKLRNSFPDKIFVIDSRKNLAKFANASYLTPNEPEIKQIFPDLDFLNEQDFYTAGNRLIKQLKIRGVVLKRGHKGMIVFKQGVAPENLPIHGSSDIVDVTGAGDTVISVISLSLLSGADLYTAARLANIAAGIVVMKAGACPIHFSELINEHR